MKFLSLHRTVCSVLSVSLGSLALMLGTTALVTAEETTPPVGKGTFVTHPDMQSVKSLSEFVAMRQKRDAAIRNASAAARRKSTPFSKETFKQLRGGMKLGKYEAWLERLRVRAYPNDRVDSASYLTAIKKQAALPAAEIITAPTSTAGARGASASAAAPAAVIVAPLVATRGAKWEFTGPRNMPSPFNGYFGPTGSQLNGRVNEVVYDPKNTNTVYICAAQGGIWKSVDGGREWFALSNAFPMLATSTLAVNPSNTQILLAGLGDHNGGDNFGNIPGMMRSTDGGRTWELVGQNLAGPAAISSVIFDPDTPNDVVASTGAGSFRSRAIGGIFHSTDAGRTWKASTFETPLSTTNGVDFRDMKVGMKKADGKRYYFATSGSGVKEIYRSEDKGKTWKAFAAPIDGTGNGIELAPSAVDPNIVYVVDGQNERVQKGVVNATGGIDWTNITGNIRTNTWSQSFYDFYIRAVPQMVDGKRSDVVYVGLININASLGGTDQWTDVSLAYTNNDRNHADQQGIGFNPLNENEMIVSSDGGVSKLTYTAATKTWEFNNELSKSLGITQFYTADWHPTNPQVALGAAQDNANPASLGNNLAWRSVGYGDGMTCAINPTNPNIMYVCSQNVAVFRTTNGFASSRGDSISPPLANNEIRPFVTISGIDPTAPHPYYVGTQYLWRWNETSQTWDARLGNTELANGARGASVQCIAVAPSDPNRIYVGTNDARLWVSTNKGVTWKKISDGAVGGSPLPNRVISSINVHPTNPNDVLVTLSGTGSAHVFRTINANATTPTFTALGATGVGAFPDNPATCIERMPDRPTTDFFVGTDIGVFYTSNGGATWQNATAPLGLPTIEVTALKATPKTGFLNASTYGRGMWRLSLKKVAETRR